MQDKAMEHGYARPFLRWVGGKSSLIDRLFAHVPPEFGTYHEVFLGGGVMFFALHTLGRLKRARLNDVNGRLVNAYRVVQDDVERVIGKLKRMPNEEEYYLRQRKRNVDSADLATQAAWFIYLNRTCFNGLYRVNAKNEFNVPFGHRKNLVVCDAVGLREVSRSLRGVEISRDDFEQAAVRAQPGDFVFCDPPYLPRVGNEFVRYSGAGFGYAEHVRLRDVMKALRDRGVKVMITNSGTEEVRQLYDGFDIEEVRVKRSVNRDGMGRGAIPDFIIT